MLITHYKSKFALLPGLKASCVSEKPSSQPQHNHCHYH